jgi:AraC family transcriptional regulator
MALSQQQTTIGRLSTLPAGWRRSSWAGGAFETAYRPFTREVEGALRSDRHLIMTTLRGGARRHVFATDDGHRYAGPDRPGSFSFLPAGCERRLKLEDVEWRWAAIALQPDSTDGADGLGGLGSMMIANDRFVSSSLTELERIDALSGRLEPIYAETIAAALKAYLLTRYCGGSDNTVRAYHLPPWRLRLVKDYVANHLGDRISVAEVAKLCKLSERHFHRAFRATTGQTPLDYVVVQRMEKAKLLLASDPKSIAQIALAVGYANPTHFARAFHAATGLNPSAYRRQTVVN